jgi:hypothetical protein
VLVRELADTPITTHTNANINKVRIINKQRRI